MTDDELRAMIQWLAPSIEEIAADGSGDVAEKVEPADTSLLLWLYGEGSPSAAGELTDRVIFRGRVGAWVLEVSDGSRATNGRGLRLGYPRRSGDAGQRDD